MLAASRGGCARAVRGLPAAVVVVRDGVGPPAGGDRPERLVRRVSPGLVPRRVDAAGG
jgi:hypothetical protein